MRSEVAAATVAALANGRPAKTIEVARAMGQKKITAYNSLVRAREQGLVEQFGYAGWRPAKAK
jgi:hypothetical protein